MTYDPTTRSVVLAGGFDCDGHASRESWRWDGERWSELTGLPVTGHVCVVYSPTRNRMLLFTLDSAAGPRAWLLRGSKWERVALDAPVSSDAACAVDPLNERVVLIGRARASAEAKTYLLLR
jgi:hypothetical protein